jgi:hypothetical protein
MDLGLILRNSIIKAFLDPDVQKIWIVGFLVVIFIAISRGLIGRSLRNWKPQKAKTATLIFIEIFLVIVAVVIWKYWGK